MVDDKLVIGIDVGGTSTKFGIVDRVGNVLYSSAVSTIKPKTPEKLVDDIFENLDPKIKNLGGYSRFLGLGIGAPNGNIHRGTIEEAANLKWKGVIKFCEIVSNKFGLSSKLTNDANAAAIGEMKYGVARDLKHFVMITLGTGVGSGIVVDGKLVYGHDGFAGEIGHWIIIPNGRVHDGTGLKGEVESYCSATGVTKTAIEKLQQSSMPSILRNYEEKDLSSKIIYEAALKGDKIANEVFEFTGNILGLTFANIIMCTSPEAIVLFGGLAKAGDLLLRPIRQTMNANVNIIFRGKVKLLTSHLKDSEAAILGASALIW